MRMLYETIERLKTLKKFWIDFYLFAKNSNEFKTYIMCIYIIYLIHNIMFKYVNFRSIYSMARNVRIVNKLKKT